MASYGKIYQFHVESINGADIVIVLLKKGYSGVMQKRALGRSPLLRQDSSGCVQGTSLEIYAEAAVDAEYAEMYTSLADEYRAEVYKNNSLIWVGFVTPELYSEPDLAPPYDVQIVATDGLGELKNYTFGKAGIDSLDEHLSYILSHTGLSLEYMMTSQLSYIDSNGITVSGIDLLKMRVDLSHLHSESCYDALQLILSSINARITQRDGKWFIYRETDMVGLATESGLYTQTSNGNSRYLNIAGFGSLERCSWWPVGNLSSVIEPAKNRIEVTSENHYKNNILNSRGWETANTAYYSEPDGAYILPAAAGSIKQRINFDTEFSNRLLLSVKARNVGSGDEDQALGVEVSIYGRTYQGRKQYWLIQPAESDRGVAAYIWRDREAAIEADLDVPSDSDTEGDAQDIEIILPLYSKDSRSYVYAEWVEVRLFSPTGPHDIYVYDCSLSLYDRRKGWQTSAKIDNVAREEAKSVDVTFTDAQTAPVSADEVMTGIPLDIYDEIVKMWKVGNQDPADYLSVITRDNAMAVALPRIKYTGILNVPNGNIPYLFLRDERLYSIESYSYDLINDELEIELLGIPVADIEITQSTNPIESGSSSSGTSPGSGSSGGTGSGGSSSLAGLQDVSLTNLAEGQLLIREGNKWVNRTIQEYLDKYNSLGDWFIKIDSVLLTKYNLASEKEVSAKGISQGSGGEGGGSSYPRLDTWDGYDSNKAGYVLSAGLGYGLKVAIDELEGYNLDSRVSAIENAGYTTKTYVDESFLNKNSGGFVYGLLTAVAGMRLTNTETNIGTLYFGATDGQTIANTDSSLLQITSPSIVLKGFTSVDGKLQATDTITALNDMSVTKGLSVGGWGTFRSGLSVEGGNLVTKYDISVNSGHQIFWTDANSVKHGITYDESAGAFKLDGKFITTGSGASLTWGEISGKPSVLDFSGTSSQFLKADGSLDSTSYLPTSGGTINGELTLSSSSLHINNGNILFNETYYLNNSGDSLRWYAWGWNTILHTGNIGEYALFERHAQVLTSKDNLNDYTSGYYGWQNSDTPINGIGFNAAMLAMRGAREYFDSFQLVFDYNDEQMYYRCRFDETNWKPWKTIAFIDSTVANSTQLDGLSSTYYAKNILGEVIDLNDIRSGLRGGKLYAAANAMSASASYRGFLEFVHGGYGGQLNQDQYGLYYRYCEAGAWSDWKTIAFTDSNLLTSLGYRYTTYNDDEKFIILGLDTAKYGYTTYIDGHNIELRLGIDSTPYITIASNGAISMAGAVTMDSTLSAVGIATDWNNTWSDGTNSNPWYGLKFNPIASIYDVVLSGYYGVVLKSAQGGVMLNQSGNVGIGTTDPAYKLDVIGDIRATESITIGGATLSWENGALKVNTSFYSEKEISAKGLSTGGGSGASYNRLDAWGDYDSSKAGYVLSAYLGDDLNTRLSSLSGVVDTHTSRLSSLENAGYITSSALSGYLPLTGGTMSGALGMTSGSIPDGAVGMWGTEELFLMASGSIKFFNLADSSFSEILHIRNLRDYAMQYYGTNMPSNIVNYVGYGKPAEGWNEIGPAISFGYGSYYAQMQMASDGSICSRISWEGSNSDWKTLAFAEDVLSTSGGKIAVNSSIQWGDTNNVIYATASTMHIDTDSNLFINGNQVIHEGNIGSQSVAYATKLATPRTIWGQIFDGTQDLSGDLHLYDSDIYWHRDKANYCIETVIHDESSPSLKIAHYGGIDFHAGGVSRMYIGYSGNVGIGTIDPKEKLDVDSTFRVFNTTNDVCLLVSSTASHVMRLASLNTAMSAWYAMSLGYNNQLYLNPASTKNNYVGINTDNPIYQLHVEGTGYFSGALTANGGLTVNGGFAANEGITTTSLVAATITANTSASIAALTVSGLSTLTGGIATNDIHGNGQSLYLGNASNNAYIKVREDMQGSSSMWSIPLDGRATFTSLTTPTLSVTGNATIASVTIEAGTATLRNLTVNTLATLKQLVVGIDGMSCNGPANFNDFIYSSSIAPDEDNYYVIGTPSKRWFKVNSYDLDLIGTATVNTIKIRSGQSIQFEDSDGSVHTLQYDSTKQAFVFDGNVNATGEMSAKTLNA